MPLSALSPIKKISANTKAAALIRDCIASGAFAPESRITEQYLSGHMQLSRATVRLALRQLCAEGLVVLKPYSGWFVAGLSSRDALEISALRAALERAACTLAVRTLSQEQERVLKAGFERLFSLCAAPAASLEDIAGADYDLHRNFVRFCGNERLTFHYMQLDVQIRRCIRTTHACGGTAASIATQHRPILDAVLARNAEEAGARLERHCLEEGAKLAACCRAEEQAHRGE